MQSTTSGKNMSCQAKKLLIHGKHKSDNAMYLTQMGNWNFTAFRVGFCFNLLTTVSERVPKMVWLNWCRKDKPILAYQRRNLHKEPTTQNSINQFRQVSYQNILITFWSSSKCPEKWELQREVQRHRLRCSPSTSWEFLALKSSCTVNLF